MGTVEVLATISIAVVAIKLLHLLISPKGYLEQAKTISKHSKAIKITLLVGAAIILYFLIGAGITITQILAISLFISLLAGASLIDYTDAIFKKLNPKTLLKENWLIILLYALLILWGVKEIYF